MVMGVPKTGQGGRGAPQEETEIDIRKSNLQAGTLCSLCISARVCKTRAAAVQNRAATEPLVVAPLLALLYIERGTTPEKYAR